MHLDVDLTAAVITFLTAFAVSAVSGRFLIPFLRNLKAGQTERGEGPKSHLKKTGTPNMGGLMILLGVTVGSLLPFRGHTQSIPILILTIGFGIIGFADDYIKVVKKRSDGLFASQKLALQIVVALLFAFYVQKIHYVPLSMKIPFMSGRFLDLGIFNIPVMVFIIVATVNGTNFTDGVDGLASCVTIAVTVFFVIAAAAAASGVTLKSSWETPARLRSEDLSQAWPICSDFPYSFRSSDLSISSRWSRSLSRCCGSAGQAANDSSAWPRFTTISNSADGRKCVLSQCLPSSRSCWELFRSWHSDGLPAERDSTGNIIFYRAMPVIS